MKRTISARTKCLGYGYNSTELDSDGNLALPKTPNYSGSVKELREYIKNDIKLQQVKRNNEYSWAFFYKRERIIDATSIDEQEDIECVFFDFMLNGYKVKVNTEKVQ